MANTNPQAYAIAVANPHPQAYALIYTEDGCPHQVLFTPNLPLNPHESMLYDHLSRLTNETAAPLLNIMDDLYVDDEHLRDYELNPRQVYSSTSKQDPQLFGSIQKLETMMKVFNSDWRFSQMRPWKTTKSSFEDFAAMLTLESEQRQLVLKWFNFCEV